MIDLFIRILIILLQNLCTFKEENFLFIYLIMHFFLVIFHHEIKIRKAITIKNEH